MRYNVLYTVYLPYYIYGFNGMFEGFTSSFMHFSDVVLPTKLRTVLYSVIIFAMRKYSDGRCLLEMREIHNTDVWVISSTRTVLEYINIYNFKYTLLKS